SMATIGRSRAVAVVNGVRLTGRLAWWAWLVVHLVMLIGFRNRLVVLVDWAWNYFTYDRGLRAIVGAEDEAGGAGARAPGPARPPEHAARGRLGHCGGGIWTTALRVISLAGILVAPPTRRAAPAFATVWRV